MRLGNIPSIVAALGAIFTCILFGCGDGAAANSAKSPSPRVESVEKLVKQLVSNDGMFEQMMAVDSLVEIGPMAAPALRSQQLSLEARERSLRQQGARRAVMREGTAIPEELAYVWSAQAAVEDALRRIKAKE